MISEVKILASLLMISFGKKSMENSRVSNQASDITVKNKSKLVRKITNSLEIQITCNCSDRK
jgi:hypothetical protein